MSNIEDCIARGRVLTNEADGVYRALVDKSSTLAREELRRMKAALAFYAADDERGEMAREALAMLEG